MVLRLNFNTHFKILIYKGNKNTFFNSNGHVFSCESYFMKFYNFCIFMIDQITDLSRHFLDSSNKIMEITYRSISIKTQKNDDKAMRA